MRAPVSAMAVLRGIGVMVVAEVVTVVLMMTL
jgi:hypothetical protein